MVLWWVVLDEFPMCHWQQEHHPRPLVPLAEQSSELELVLDQVRLWPLCCVLELEDPSGCLHRQQGHRVPRPFFLQFD
jgi:hypothetical protein